MYYAVRDNVLRLVKERCAGIREVLVTGHSLGGALATLALPDIVNFLRAQPEVPAGLKVLLYSLASPRAGHADFKTFFTGAVLAAHLATAAEGRYVPPGVCD